MSSENQGGGTHGSGLGCGTLTALFGAMIIGGAAVEFGEKTAKPADLVMAFLFGVVPLVLGTYWVVCALRARQKAAWEAIEREVLRYAMEHGGLVTPVEIAAHTELSLAQARSYLDSLVDQGFIQLMPTDRGLVYQFPGAKPSDEQLRETPLPMPRPPLERNRE